MDFWIIALLVTGLFPGSPDQPAIFRVVGSTLDVKARAFCNSGWDQETHQTDGGRPVSLGAVSKCSRDAAKPAF